jgi:hypothetical protein
MNVLAGCDWNFRARISLGICLIAIAEFGLGLAVSGA